MNYVLRLFQRPSGWCSLTIIIKKESNVLSLQKFYSIHVFSMAINAVYLYPPKAATSECAITRQYMLVWQIKWGIALSPNPTYRNLTPASSWYWEAFIYLIMFPQISSWTFSFALVPPSYLVMTSASSQMSSSPHWYPFCCHLLCSLIANLANFNVLCLQKFGWWKFLHEYVSALLGYDHFYLWNDEKYEEKVYQAFHDRHKQSLKICIHTPSLLFMNSVISYQLPLGLRRLIWHLD